MSDNPAFPADVDLVVFQGERRLAAGDVASAVRAAWRALSADAATTLVVLDRRTGRVVDLDLRGSEDQSVARHAPAAALPQAPGPEASSARRGRPKLGVTAREVTLLPRHWDWLAAQPGGASATLRRLVETARKTDGDASARRARLDAAYRFMSVMAGDRPGFEEAARALYAGDEARLRGLVSGWPADIADETLTILAPFPHSA